MSEIPSTPEHRVIDLARVAADERARAVPEPLEDGGRGGHDSPYSVVRVAMSAAEMERALANVAVMASHEHAAAFRALLFFTPAAAQQIPFVLGDSAGSP